jgi:hypothetical protein
VTVYAFPNQPELTITEGVTTVDLSWVVDVSNNVTIITAYKVYIKGSDLAFHEETTDCDASILDSQ